MRTGGMARSCGMAGLQASRCSWHGPACAARWPCASMMAHGEAIMPSSRRRVQGNRILPSSGWTLQSGFCTW
jgi:hypothetical protein